MAECMDDSEVFIDAPSSSDSPQSTCEELTPSRKRCASQDASSLDRMPFCETPESSTAETESTAGSEYAAPESERSCGFLRVETAMMPSISEGQLPREDMMLYNWQKMTMSALSPEGIKECLDIEQPLAQILCRASSVLIKDNQVFASVSTNVSYAVQVYDLRSGELLKEIDSKALSGSSKIVLSSYRHRIYAAVFGGRRIFEIYPNYKLHKVAEVKKGVGNFWVEHQDVSSFLCTYIEARTRNPFTYLRFKSRSLDHRLSNYNFAHDLILGCHNGTSYLLPNDRRRIVIAYKDGTAYEFCLKEEIYFPYSLSYCGEFLYVLRGEGILVINTKTKNRSIIRNTQVADKVDEECRLIKRIATPPF